MGDRFRPSDARFRRSLQAFVKAMTSTRDLAALLRRAFELVEGAVQVDAMIIAVVDDRGRYAKLLETDLDDVGNRVFCPPRAMHAISPAVQRLRHERYILVLRTAEEMRRVAGGFEDGEPWTPVGNPRRRSASLLYVPIWEGPKYAGLVSVQSYRPNAYRKKDAEQVIVVADYVGLAIRHATRLGRRID